MNTKILIICAVAISIFASCHKDDELTEFSLQRGGGWTALDEDLKINAGATHYSINYRNLQTSERISYETTVKTSDELWDVLLKTFDLKTFKKIKDGRCSACVDGVDEIFSVTQDGNTYSVYNGYDDEHYKQMQDFFNAIIEQANILSTKK